MGFFNPISALKPTSFESFSSGFMQGVNTATKFATDFGGMMMNLAGGGGANAQSNGLLNDIKGMLGQLMNKMDQGQGQGPADACCGGGMSGHETAGGPTTGGGDSPHHGAIDNSDSPGTGGHDPRADNLHEKLAFEDFNNADKAKGSLFQSKADAKKEHLDKGLDTLERDGYDVSKYRELVNAAEGDSDELNDISEHMKGLLAPHAGDFAESDHASPKMVGTDNNIPLQS